MGLEGVFLLVARVDIFAVAFSVADGAANAPVDAAVRIVTAEVVAGGHVEGQAGEGLFGAGGDVTDENRVAALVGVAADEEESADAQAIPIVIGVDFHGLQGAGGVGGSIEVDHGITGDGAGGLVDGRVAHRHRGFLPDGEGAVFRVPVDCLVITVDHIAV